MKLYEVDHDEKVYPSYVKEDDELQPLQDEEIADGLKALLFILCVLTTAYAFRFVLIVLKTIFMGFGIEINL